MTNPNQITGMDDPTEWLDRVDRNDVVIDQIQRSRIVDILSGDLDGFVRAAGCFVMNNSGRIFVPRRSEKKKIAPNGLDASAEEHVGAGEDYKQAAVRGLEEELSLTIDPDEVVYLGKVEPRPNLPYFYGSFVVHTEQEPVLGADYVSAEWLTPTELQARLQAGETAKDTLLPAVELLIERL